MRRIAAVGVAGDDRVADAQRAALDEHGGHRAAATVEVRLDRDTLGVLVGIARRSSDASAVSSTASSRASMLVPCLAEMSTNIASPPYSSGTRPYSVSWPRILLGSAPPCRSC